MGLEPTTWLELALGGALFASGVLIGSFAAQFGSRAQARIRELEEELHQEREEGAAYQDAVAKHFGRTSDLFRELTQQYTFLYAHLAEGARDLCADRLPALARGFGDPGLAIGDAPGRDRPADEPAGQGAPQGEPGPAG